MAFFVGHMLRLNRDIRLKDRDYYRDTFYEPLYQQFHLLEKLLAKDWFVNAETLHRINEFISNEKASALPSKIQKDLSEITPILQELEKDGEETLESIRSNVREHIKSQSLAFIDQDVFPAEINWTAIIERKVNIPAPKSNQITQIQIPASTGGIRELSIAFNNEKLEGEITSRSWNSFLEALADRLDNDPLVSKHATLRKQALAKLNPLTRNLSHRRWQPFTFLEYYFPRFQRRALNF